MIQQELIQVAYSMYPKHIHYNEHERYKQSSQHQNLLKKINEVTRINSSWNAMLNALGKTNIQLEEVGPGKEMSKSYQIGIPVLTDPRRMLVLTISKLVPYYCFYSAHNVRRGASIGAYEFVSWQTREEPDLIRVIEPYLQKEFPEYQELFPPELNTEVPDIMDEEMGMVGDNPHGLLYRKMTLFGAFFNAFIYY